MPQRTIYRINEKVRYKSINKNRKKKIVLNYIVLQNCN